MKHWVEGKFSLQAAAQALIGQVDLDRT